MRRLLAPADRAVVIHWRDKKGPAMAVDNDIYDRIGDTWWDDDNPLVALCSMTAGRMHYFHSVLERLGRLPGGVGGGRALDIGSGGGFLAEEFCRLGFSVIGVDRSEISVRTARAHAAAGGLDIDYRVGFGERLPVRDAAFDVAYCCDVLEHVDDIDSVLAEGARALRPGGVFLFDSPNRTGVARIALKATQQWRLTRVIDFAAHDWTRFQRPQELSGRMGCQGLTVQQIVGLGPHANPWVAFKSLLGLRRRHLNYRQVSERLDMGRTNSTALFYMGYALKN